MTRSIAVVVALMLSLAACGGADDNADGNAGGASGEQPAPNDDIVPPGEPDDETPPPASAEGSGPSTATLTLGDQTYNFSTEASSIAQCKTDLFGIFSAQLAMVDGDGGINVVVLHDDTDPVEVDQLNAVRVSIGDEDWLADEGGDLFDMSDNVQPGMSQVDSAQIEGRTARGTATFVRQLSVFSGEVETMTGTFEATCGEERIS